MKYDNELKNGGKNQDDRDNDGMHSVQLARTAGRVAVTSLAIRRNRLAGNAV
jgi:hypothetical protein